MKPLHWGELVRYRDVTAEEHGDKPVLGVLAHVVECPNGKAIIAWLGEFKTVDVLDSVDQVLAIHGHNGATLIVWNDDVPERYAESAGCLSGPP